MINKHLSDALSRLAAIARQHEWAVGEDESITPTQADVIRLLVQHSDGVGMKALAELLSVSQPTASDAVAALVRKDLVVKEKGIEDKRSVVLRLADDGNTLAEKLETGFSSIVKIMPEKDKQQLLGITSRAILKLHQVGKIPMQKMCLSCRYFEENRHAGSNKPHHCRLINSPLGEGDLRIHCPEHELESVMDE